MKTNFLCRNTLPRGSCVFLKMVVTITALLCSVMTYAQPIQTAPTDGADVTIPVTLQWATNSTENTEIEVYRCNGSGTVLTDIDLEGYQPQVSKALSVPAGQPALVDLSGVTYSPVTGTLFMITNKGPARIFEFSVDGDYIRTIDLLNEQDTEDIVHLYGDTFAIVEEKRGEVRVVNIVDSDSNATLNLANATITPLPSPDFEPYVEADGGRDGIEGVSYNPANGTVYCVTEIPMQLHSFDINDTSPNSTLSTTCDLSSTIVNDQQSPNSFGITDLSAIHHLGLTKGLEHLDVDNHILLLSDESNVLIETDENCNEYSRLQLPVSAFGGTNNTQLEGVTMDDCGNIYVVGEPNHFFVYSNNNLDLNPPKPLVHNASTPNSTYSIPPNVNLQIGTDYCWRVKSNDECIWSPLWSFKPIDPCSAAYLQEVGCDDSDDCTINDIKIVSNFDGSVCTPCAGTFVPSSCNATCTTTESCDDGDPCTIGDVETIAANGNICVPCMGTLDASSCDAPCVTVQNCDDGDPLTVNDMESVAEDGSICSACAGVSVSACSDTTTQPCDDNNSCTQNDVETISNLDGSTCIPCMGTTDVSSCDAPCATVQSCDDSNPLTINDMESVATDGNVCVPCAGTLVDACSDTSPLPCNDGNPCTEGDAQIVSNLDGSICVPCAGQINPSSCNTSCTSTRACDDNDPCTTNDEEVVAADGTICVPCAGIINISSCDEACDTYEQTCDDGNPCTENDMKIVANDGTICVPCEGTLIIDSNCACAVEQSCNDGSLLTVNDLISVATDGTVCEPCAGTSICNILPPSSRLSRLCNDGDDCTVVDTEYYFSDASETVICVPCAGTFKDDDNDGVCNAEDTCPGADDNIDVNGNGIPDACDDECPEDLIIVDADIPGDYEAVNTITTDESTGAVVLVDVGEQLELNAGYYVKLTPGFNATHGSTMRAYIKECEPSSQKVEQATFASVTHYPNPFRDEVTLEFNLEANAEAQIIVSDVNGRTIRQIQIDHLTRGIQTHSISTQDWIPGIYFYQVQIKAQNTGILRHANGTLVKM